MAPNVSEFSKAFPEHPNRRLNILLSVLAFCIVVSSVLLYQVRMGNIRFDNRGDISVAELNFIKQQLMLMEKDKSSTYQLSEKDSIADTIRLLQALDQLEKEKSSKGGTLQNNN